jgi:glycosyltransferase involved in cell wall biosynthesis
MLPESIVSGHPTYLIPNPLDTDVFRPHPKLESRRAVNAPPGKRILLCTAVDLSRYFKGMDLMVTALNSLPSTERASLALLVMGNGAARLSEMLDLEVVDLGFIEDDACKAVIYSAADVLIVPSRAESFGNVIAEGIACGTPVVAFSVGSIPELVVSGETGLLAAPENPADLAARLLEALSAPVELRRMGEECRALAVETFSEPRVVQKYIRLYNDLLAEKPAAASPRERFVH